MTEHRLTELEHHDIELMVAGVLPLYLSLPGDDAPAPTLCLPFSPGSVGDEVTLLDREATPVARVTVAAVVPDAHGWWVAGAVQMLRPLHAFAYATLRPGEGTAVDGPATLYTGDVDPLPEPDRAVIVVDHGDPRALARAVTVATQAASAVRVLPEPSAAHLAGEARVSLLASLAREAFDIEELDVVASERSVGDGMVILLTGLSGSGKSTIAKELAERLRATVEQHVTLLDGDEVRAMLSKGLGFNREDRLLNVQRIGWVGALVAEHGGIAIAAPIAPYEEMRAEMRARVEKVGRFVLIHVATPLEVCEARDRKGLYAKARAGEIKEFTGISDPYDEPTNADLVITEDLSPAQAAEAIISTLRLEGR
ncbi:adenylyl-sulfate kinase [Demequina salsinemoris]|uniref:adenylyl-sulfate kinase n=1 Tax=Demequina salsinemoris TaxID=577470 RepID=UPI000782AF0A|nr:adenylyl-sulfate kinase [Demequina salsinemoris]